MKKRYKRYVFEDGYVVECESMSAEELKEAEEEHGALVMVGEFKA